MKKYRTLFDPINGSNQLILKSSNSIQRAEFRRYRLSLQLFLVLHFNRTFNLLGGFNAGLRVYLPHKYAVDNEICQQYSKIRIL